MGQVWSKMKAKFGAKCTYIFGVKNALDLEKTNKKLFLKNFQVYKSCLTQGNYNY